MDRETIVNTFKKKIEAFFAGKKFGDSKLNLLVVFKKSDETKLEYLFYADNAFIGRETLADIVKITWLESFKTSPEAIEKTLIERMIEFAKKHNIDQKNIGLRLQPGDKYYVLNNLKSFQQIQLHEII